MQRISILVPTLGRPGLCSAFLHSALATAKFPERVSSVVRVDDPDPVQFEKYRSALDGVPAVLTSGDWAGYARGVNLACELAPRDTGIYWIAADDLFVETHGWDILVERAMRTDVPFMVKNSLNHGLPFVNRAWRRFFGYLAHPVYDGWHVDSWWRDFASRSNLVAHEPLIQVRHMDPHDETHERLGKTDLVDASRFKALGGELDHQVDKVKRWNP